MTIQETAETLAALRCANEEIARLRAERDDARDELLECEDLINRKSAEIARLQQVEKNLTRSSGVWAAEVRRLQSREREVEKSRGLLAHLHAQFDNECKQKISDRLKERLRDGDFEVIMEEIGMAAESLEMWKEVDAISEIMNKTGRR